MCLACMPGLCVLLILLCVFLILTYSILLTYSSMCLTYSYLFYLSYLFLSGYSDWDSGADVVFVGSVQGADTARVAPIKALLRAGIALGFRVV
jgi:hypothetical protein